jgi:hypothetical protein
MKPRQSLLNSPDRRRIWRGWGACAAVVSLGLVACRPSASVPSPATVERPDEVLCIHSENNGALWLVQMETVARELQLTEKQQDLFATWSREAVLQTNRLIAQWRADEDSASEQQTTESRKKSEELVKGFHRQVVAALEPPQVRRLDELFLRYLGPRLFFFQPLTKRLEITASQMSKLNEVLKNDYGSYEKLLEVLTPAQHDALDKLLGEPFDFPTPETLRLEVE